MARVRKGVGKGSLARKVCIACNDSNGSSLGCLNIYLDSQALCTTLLLSVLE